MTATAAGPACQRWLPGGHPTWAHPARGQFDPARYGAAPIPEADAKRFVTTHHYSGTYPAAAHRYGLFDLAAPGGPRLAGVAVLSIPPSKNVILSVFPHLEPYHESLELGRFVLADDVPANGESWFLAQCHRLAAASGVRGVVSFSDPLPRTTTAGQTVTPGHVGVIYQASNAVYTGRGTARTITLLPDGRILADRAAQKIRSRERGHEYAERQLVALGARPPAAGENPAAWLAHALDDIHARRVRHPGNHRYAFRLGTTRRGKTAVHLSPSPRPYPKHDLSQAA